VSRGSPWTASLLAIAAGTGAFLVATFLHRMATPAKVAVVAQPVAAGQPLLPEDVRWQSVSTWSPPRHAWARQDLVAGEVLSPAVVTASPISTPLQTVAVVPAASQDLTVAHPGGWVEILVVSNHGLVWQSGSVPVLAVTRAAQGVLGSGGQAVTVAMAEGQALAYETARVKGTVELVGTGP